MNENSRFLNSRPAGEHYLVAVSGSGNSEYLIRWTSAVVRRSGASWTAVHVRSGTEEENPEALERNLEVARKLGAEVLSIPADDIVSALIRYASIKKATALVIGKSGDEGNLTFRGRKSVMESILRESGGLNVILLKGETPIPPRRRRLFPIVPLLLRDILPVIVTMAGLTALGYALHSLVGYRSIAVFYLLGIVYLGLVVGRGALLLAALLSSFAWNFLFIPPRLGFSFSEFEDFFLFSSFFISAIAVGLLTSRLKRNEADLSIREERMALLYGFSRLLSRTRGAAEVASVSSSYISDHLGAEVGVYLRDRSGTLDIDEAAAGDLNVVVSDRCLAENAYFADEAGRLYFPLSAPDRTLGVLVAAGMRGGVSRDETKELLSSLAGNIALAVEREEHKTAAESERLSRTLLNHVSHELRTPLTTIKGSVSALLDSSDTSDTVFRGELLSETLIATDTLNALVENLLSMSRLETGVLRPHPEATDVLELFGAARESLRAELDGRTVTTDSSCLDAEFFVDPALMVQVFRNVLRNFIAYTPLGSSLQVSVGQSPERCEVRMEDDGPGVPTHEIAEIFDMFSRGTNGARHSGCGLGLSICKGIVEAHGGSIRAEAGRNGGFAVIFSVPTEGAS